MAAEFRPVTPRRIFATNYMSREVPPPGFAEGLQTLDVPTPQSMTVIFGPATPRPKATARRTIDWAAGRNAFITGPNGRAETVDEQTLKRLVDSEETSIIIFNLDGVPKPSPKPKDVSIDEGVEIFTNEFLPTLTGVEFFPVSGNVIGPVGAPGYTVFYKNPALELYLPTENPRLRTSLIRWFNRLPDQQ